MVSLGGKELKHCILHTCINKQKGYIVITSFEGLRSIVGQPKIKYWKWMKMRLKNMQALCAHGQNFENLKN